MYNFSLHNGIGPGERNDKHDLADFGRGLEQATGLDPWLAHSWTMAAFPEAHTSDGYMPGFGGALRGFQIAAGLYPDGVARSGGPTERTLRAALNPNRGGRRIDADEVYRGAPPGTGSLRRDRPADGGAKAAARIRKLAHRTGGSEAGNGSAKGNARQGIPTIPPPGIRQSVGAGGANAHDDLLQVQRNLARLGYAPPVGGIGESAESRSVAVRNGLLAYQQAKDLKADARMDPDGATERALHRQIGVQQERLKGQMQKDAAEAAAKLSAGGRFGNPDAIGSPESVAARTLGARMTGAKVEAQQREAYAETRDSVKRVADGAKDGSGAEAGANAGVDRKRPQGVAAHPLVRSRVRRAEQRADAQMQAAHRAKEAAQKAAYDADQEKSNDLLRDRIGTDALSLTPERERKVALEVAGEAGSLPSASTGWFDDLGQEVEQAQARSLPGGGESAHNERDRQTLLEGYAYLERVRGLVAAKPHNWLGVTRRWRALAAVVESLEKGENPKTEDERVALMVRAGRRIDEKFRQSRGDSLRLIGDFMSFVPGPGEAIALVQGIDAFLNGERAAAAGRSDEAEKLRVEAAILFATAIPGAGRLIKLLHKAAKSLGKKTGRSLTALAERVKKRAQGKGGRGRSHSPASRRKKNTEDDSKVPVPGPWKLWLEQRLIDVPGLKQDTAQKMLFRITRPRKGLGRNPNVAQVFDGVLPELTRRQRRRIRKKYRRMFGPAGEHHLVWLMNTAGDDTVEHTNRHFTAGGTRFGADAFSNYKYEVVRKNRLAPNFRKADGTIGDHKGGVGAHLTGPQGEAHSWMRNGEPAIAMTNDAIRARNVMVARSDFHEYNLRQIKNIIQNDLGIGNFLTPEQMDRVMRNVTELHKASIPTRALKFGSVMAFVMISAAVMAAQSDSGKDDGAAPYPVTP